MSFDASPPAPAPPAPPVDAPALLRRVQAAYERGRYLTAWRLAAPLGAPEGWPGVEGLLLAGRMANQLGNERLGALLHLRARRRHPESGEAWLWAARVACERLGPWRGRALLARGGPPGTPPEELLALRGRLAADLRDFDEAERLLAEAVALAPDDPWTALQPGVAQARADDHQAALATADRALALRPWYRPAVDFRAHTLLALGRDDEALAWLHEATGHLEAASTCEVLLQLQLDRGEHRAAEATLARLEELTPLRSRAYQGWLEGRRSDAAYHLGDRARAAAHARRSRNPFYLALADRLEADRADRPARRVVLPVPFVRQHHLTCAPATLSALCALHGVPATHLGIAEAICYDGTPEHAERRWARERGFTAREFTVTWDAAVALLDRGLPFTLSMVEPGGSHLVAVAGYDEARGVLLLRDPSWRSLTEITPGWLDDHRASGPRGMALAPPGQAGLLDGLELPDAALHDLYHQVQAALVDHDRPAAAGGVAALQAAAPGHRLALQAERSLAAYDGSEERQLAATEALLAAYPDDVLLRLARQASLGSLGQRQARIDWLRAEHARAPHPLLAQMLGEALMDDARALGEAMALALAGVRRRPGDGLGFHLLGDALWSAGQRDESLLAYRFAACLDRTNEHFADAYFRASRVLGRTGEGLAFLRGRYERHGGQSARPTITLVDALDALEQGAEGQAVLEAALARRPDDGALLLYAARTLALAGQPARARDLLARARGPAHPAEVLRTGALLAELEGDLAAAARARVEASELEPLSVAGAQAAARLLAETQDRAAAVAFLQARVDRFPHHVGLGRALVGWLDEAPPARLEAELRRLVAVAPADAWAWRELALHLSGQGRVDEAFEVLERAAAVEPDAPALQNVRSTVLARAGRVEEARQALRASLRLDVDQEWVVDRLMALASDAADRAGELRRLHEELGRQVTFGDALLAYQRHATGVLAPEEALAALRAQHAARPDLWHAWVALGGQLVLMERTDEARALLTEATARFPLLPRLWLELGLVHRAGGDGAGWRRMLERALELNPAWRDATFRLAEVLQGDGEFEAARALLVRALRHAPSDGVLHGWLADALLALGRREEAVEALQRALRLEPGYGWALEALRREARRLGRPELVGALAEQLVAERPLDARAWLLAARTRARLPARLEAAGRALALSPTFAAAVTLQVELLAEAGRYEEALAAAAAPPWQGPPPRALRLRVAQLEAQRGRAREARVALDELLEAEPDFLEGWEVAAEWHDAAGRHWDCLRAARQLVRLGPQRSTSLGWLGLALLACDDRAGATEALVRAVQLDPAYHWAVRRLFELRVEERAWDEAAALMVLVERHFEPAEQHALRLRLQAGRGEWGPAAAELAALAAVADARELEAAAAALADAGGGEALERALAAALEAPGAPRAAGLAWFTWMRRRHPAARAGARLAEALARPGPLAPAMAGALRPWLELLGETGQRWRLRRLLARHGATLAADAELWGTTGYALTSAGAHRRAVAWLQASADRPGVEPWMLLNLASSLCHLGRLAEGAAACRAALRHPPDHTRARLEAVVALEAALRGEPAGVEAPDEAEDLGRTYGCMAWLARALRAAAASDGGRAGWSDAAPHLARAAACATALQEPGFLQVLWLRALGRLARRLGRGGPATALWFLRGLAVALRPR